MASSPDPGAVPAFANGVRLRTERDGSALLLVPEGIVRLNGAAAATLALVDGTRSVGEIVAALAGARYDVDAARIDADVRALFARLRDRHLLR